MRGMERANVVIRRLARMLVIASVAVITACGLYGCSPTRYVPVESVRTEYVGKDNAELLNIIKQLSEQITQKDRRIDSLMRSRNERLVLNDKGDTLRHDTELIIYRSSHREKELEHLVQSQTDSIRELQQRLESVKADTIRIPYPVEKRLTRWQQTKIDYGGEAIIAIAVIIIAAVAWLIKKFRK